MKLSKLIAAATMSLTFCASASAAVLYTNGSLDGNYGANTIDSTFAVSDSFTLTSDATVGAVTAGIWTPNYLSAITDLNWSIGSSAFGTDLGASNASVVNQLANVDQWGYAINLATFQLDLALSAGTYWLTLTSDRNSGVYWDINHGPSSAMQKFGNDGAYAVDSHYFTLSSSDVPEPASLALVGLGVAGLCAARRRRAHRAA